MVKQPKINTAELKQIVAILHEELDILQEREAKFAGNAPLDLLNQITDYEDAIALTEQAISGELSEAELSEALKPVNLSIKVSQRIHSDEFIFIPTNHGMVSFTSDQQLTLQPRERPVDQRPRPPLTLLDRGQEVDTGISALLDQPHSYIEFYGQPGIGKSSLLRHLAHQVPEVSFPDGVLFRSGRRKEINDLLQEIFDAFFECEEAFKPSESKMVSYLNQLRAFIILDDVDLDRQDVEVLLDAAPHCAFLLASNTQHLYGGGRAVPLKGLPLDEATILIEQELLTMGKPLTSEEHAAIRTICTALDGHPLHILQVVTKARNEHLSLEEVAADLVETSSEKKRAIILLPTLSNAERLVLSSLDTLDGLELFSEHIAAVTDLPNVESVLNTLVKKHLIRTDGIRYVRTDMVSQIVQSGHDEYYWAKQVLDHFVTWAEQYQNVPELLIEETDALRQALKWAVESGHWPEALRLTQAVEGSFAWGGRWDAWEEVLRNGLKAAKALKNQMVESWLLNQRGVRALGLGDSQAAKKLLVEALRIRESINDSVGAAVTRQNLNHAYQLITQSEPLTEASSKTIPNRSTFLRPGTIKIPLILLFSILVLVSAVLTTGAQFRELINDMLVAEQEIPVVTILNSTPTRVVAATKVATPTYAPTITTQPTQTILTPTTVTVEPDKWLGVVTPPALNVRNGPDTGCFVLEHVTEDQVVEITGRNSGWWLVASPSTGRVLGWVSASYIDASNTDDVPFVPVQPCLQSQDQEQLQPSAPPENLDESQPLSPAPMVSIEGCEHYGAGAGPILRWKYDQPLAEDEFFKVTIEYWQPNATAIWYDYQWVNEPWLEVPNYLYQLLPSGRDFTWSVAVARKTGVNANGIPIGPDVSNESETVKCIWFSDSGGNDSVDEEDSAPTGGSNPPNPPLSYPQQPVN